MQGRSTKVAGTLRRAVAARRWMAHSPKAQRHTECAYSCLPPGLRDVDIDVLSAIFMSDTRQEVVASWLRTIAELDRIDGRVFGVHVANPSQLHVAQLRLVGVGEKENDIGPQLQGFHQRVKVPRAAGRHDALH